MSYVKNRKPLEQSTYSNGWTALRWKTRHTSNCQSHCPCCAGDLDCDCGAVTYKAPKSLDPHSACLHPREMP